jgi:hypothetical protein
MVFIRPSTQMLGQYISQATTTSFPVLSNSLLNHLTVRHYTSLVLDIGSVVKEITNK